MGVDGHTQCVQVRRPRPVQGDRSGDPSPRGCSPRTDPTFETRPTCNSESRLTPNRPSPVPTPGPVSGPLERRGAAPTVSDTAPGGGTGRRLQRVWETRDGPYPTSTGETSTQDSGPGLDSRGVQSSAGVPGTRDVQESSRSGGQGRDLLTQRSRPCPWTLPPDPGWVVGAGVGDTGLWGSSSLTPPCATPGSTAKGPSRHSPYLGTLGHGRWGHADTLRTPTGALDRRPWGLPKITQTTAAQGGQKGVVSPQESWSGEGLNFGTPPKRAPSSARTPGGSRTSALREDRGGGSGLARRRREQRYRRRRPLPSLWRKSVA